MTACKKTPRFSTQSILAATSLLAAMPAMAGTGTLSDITLSGNYTVFNANAVQTGTNSAGTTIGAIDPASYLTWSGADNIAYSGSVANNQLAVTAVAGQAAAANTPSMLASWSNLTYQATVTNTGSAAADYGITLNTGNSYLQVQPQGEGFDTAEISSSVTLSNGTTAMSGAGFLEVNGGGPGTSSFLYNSTGAGYTNYSLAPDSSGQNGISYEKIVFGNNPLNVSIGELQPGQSITVYYNVGASTDMEFYGTTDINTGNILAGTAINGQPFSVYSTPAPVPEPGTASMMISGLLALGFLARRKMAQQSA